MLPSSRLIATRLLKTPLNRHTIRLNTRNMHIQPIPMWTGSSDNYAYLVSDEVSKEAVIIDPAHASEVLPVLKQKIEAGDIKLTAIINTHHHMDHAGGNRELLKHYEVPVIGGKDCDAVTKQLQGGESFKIGKIEVETLATPCHTLDSICYHMKDNGENAVFTGDTLFIGGCGRFFEGTAEQMDDALNNVLGSLPADTKIYPGHEYTAANMKFGVSVFDTAAVKKAVKLAEDNEVTCGKSTIAEEKQHNVFMRLDDETIQKATGETERTAVMAKLREMKNNFKG